VENTLRVLRATKNITQEDLAKALGVTRQTIHAIETGKYNPSLDLAFKIAIHFDTRIEDVFTYKEDSSLTS
jgi:putative transcriptional regulator